MNDIVPRNCVNNVLAWLDLGLWSDSSQSLKVEREYRLHDEAEVNIESLPRYLCQIHLPYVVKGDKGKTNPAELLYIF